MQLCVCKPFPGWENLGRQRNERAAQQWETKYYGETAIRKQKKNGLSLCTVRDEILSHHGNQLNASQGISVLSQPYIRTAQIPQSSSCQCARPGSWMCQDNLPATASSTEIERPVRNLSCLEERFDTNAAAKSPFMRLYPRYGSSTGFSGSGSRKSSLSELKQQDRFPARIGRLDLWPVHFFASSRILRPTAPIVSP